MHIVVIGASGQLGNEIGAIGRREGRRITALDLPAFDLTDALSVAEVLGRIQGDLVINCAAYTAVDQAESNQEAAYAVNRDGPGHLARFCANSQIPLIHMSTDYVFDGQKGAPYLENDPPRPATVYGRSKAQGEAAVREALAEHIIVRTAWLYSVYGHNFVKTMLRLGAERDRVSVVDDQRGNPTNARDLAEALLVMADRIAARRAVWGTYHFTGAGSATWYEFAVRIFRLARRYRPLRVKEVQPITTAQYPTPARRPPDSRLDCSLIKDTYGMEAPPWADSLAVMLEQHLSKHEGS